MSEVDATNLPVKKTRRPKSDLRTRLENLQSDETIRIAYGRDKKTPFAVAIAIKRKQLGKHFVFTAVGEDSFDVWIGDRSQRSRSAIGGHGEGAFSGNGNGSADPSQVPERASVEQASAV